MADFELFSSLDGEHSQYSYAAFLCSIEETWKKSIGLETPRVFLDEGSKHDLIKPRSSLFAWMEEPKAPHTTTELNCGEDPSDITEGDKYELKPSSSLLDDNIHCSRGCMEALKAPHTTTELNICEDPRDLSEGKKYDLKITSRSLFDDNIQCSRGWLEEPKPPPTMTELKFGEDPRDLTEGTQYVLKPASSSLLDDIILRSRGWMEEPEAPLSMTQLNSDNAAVFQAVSRQQTGGRKHKVKWKKMPMEVLKVLTDLQDAGSRGNALRDLSRYLIQVTQYLKAGQLSSKLMRRL